MSIAEILAKSREGAYLSKQELIQMLNCPSDSAEAFQIMAESKRLSRELTDGKAEVHAQFALNLSPCFCDCLFCSFAEVNKVFDKNSEINVEEAIEKARQFEENGANAIYVMTTAKYPFKKFIEISKEIRRSLSAETTLIANIGDAGLEQAKCIKEAGYQGVYHALRLREGIDTRITPDQRKKSIRNFKEAGLEIGTCVEPVGPEHTNEELADMILFCSSINPAFSGAARRITIPTSSLAQFGMISELRMAHIAAVTRLGTSPGVLGNCTHEPCTLGAITGANLFWAETGANPRDINENTEKGRGATVESCKKIFFESEWKVLSGRSKYFSGNDSLKLK